MTTINRHRADCLAQIVSELNEHSYIGMYGVFSGNTPERGEFVITGPNMGPVDKRVAYVCQIRIGCGQFGSDMYLLRHADGGLTVHENNCYLRMTPSQVERARKVFKTLPEQELADNPECIYRDCEKVEAVGFIVHASGSKPTPDTPFTITVTDDSGDLKEVHRHA